MFSRFFIDRPIFASVMSIVITLAGLVAIPTLPLAQYPQITPPSIIVQCNYPGADAKVVAESVAAPIEQQVNGVEDMIYMSSQCANDGSYSLSVTFKPGVNLNFAQVLVQNRVNLALPLLPDVVKQTGVTTRKRNPDILLIVSIYSPKDTNDQLYLSNYATLRITDELKRVDGVGDVFNFGQQDYSMRVWVDPDRLASLNLTAGDVVDAIREQNQQVAAGQLAQPPADTRAPFAFPITMLGRLSEPEQFDDIIVRTAPDGRKVHIKDVAPPWIDQHGAERNGVELGARNQDVTSKIDGHPCSSLAVFQLPYANALATADRVREKMEDLKKRFPADLDYAIAFDTTPFIDESIKGVYHSLAEAIFLVALVVLVFLQNWRSTLIPLTAVPVAIIGTFAAMAAIGFSLNNLTLFGLVLAIGIVVDDAIVVVEAVEHHIEEGMAPRQAAYKAMEEVSGPVVAVALVLSAVFIPCAFISGITGQFFRQFALTIAVSTIISAFNSLTLSPALAAILLKPRTRGKYEAMPKLVYVAIGGALGYFAVTLWLRPHLSFAEDLFHFLGPERVRMAAPWVAALVAAGAGWLLAGGFNYVLGWFFRLFNWSFRRTSGIYLRLVGLALRGSVVVLVVYGGLMGLTWWGFTRLPTGYIPNQDQRRLYAALQLPDSASLERTQQVADRIAKIAGGDPADPERYPGVTGVTHTISVAGQSFVLSANGSNFGNLFITLEDFGRAGGSNRTSSQIADELKEKITSQIPEALVTILGPPPVSGLGSTGGFKFIIEDRSGDNDLNKLQRQTDKLIAASRPRAGESAVKKASVKAKPEENDIAKAALKPARAPDTASDLAAKPEPKTAAAETGAAKPDTPKTPAPGESLITIDKITPKSEPDPSTKPPSDAGAQVEAAASKVAGLFTVFRANSPQLYVDLNRDQCQTMGVNPRDVFTTLQVYLGSLYVNDFNKFGRTWQVVVQAQSPFRNDAEAVKRLKVRNTAGNMVPLGAVLSVSEISGPILLMRYNMYPAAAVVGNTAPGVSSGQGIDAMQKLAKETLPQSMGYEWTEINYIQVDAAKNIWNNLIFPLAVVFVFLVLAAQYESWALPLAVILVVPMCILGSLTGVAATRSEWFTNGLSKIGLTVTPNDINIFTQIGFVVLVGLASKNAILIVEFAKHKREQGLSRRDATLEACTLRLRPILMTSFAFILGVMPLMLASGAGSEMRKSLGTAVFSGMLGVTLFGIFLTPVFFYVIEWFIDTPLFRSTWMRRLGAGSLAVLTFPRHLTRYFVYVRHERRPLPAAAPPAVSPNGAGSRDGQDSDPLVGTGEHKKLK